MKRVLSWLVVLVLSVVFAFASSLVLSLADKLLLWLQRFNETLYWVFIVLEGITVLWFIFFAVWLSAAGVVSASNGVCKSQKGTRFIVIGILCLVFTLLCLGLVILAEYLGTVTGRIFPVYFVYGTWIVYCIVLMVTGKKAAGAE